MGIRSLIKVFQKHNHVVVKNTGGLRGYTGPQGPVGAKGDKGDMGTAATVAVGQTSTLDAGSNATVTNIGTSNAAVFSFGIPKGDKGDKGDAGAGLIITGSVATYADLPSDLAKEDAGKAYFCQADGKLYVWSGTSFPADGDGSQFEGPQGPQGVPGPTGFSPIANVTQTQTGATISITDVSGTTSADINNGTTPTIDSALSTTSENPVQNKVITSTLSNKQDTLTDGDITDNLLADNAVLNPKVGNGAITGAANADTTIGDSDSKIDLATIGTPNLRDFAVNTSKLSTGAVTTDKIADGAVTSHKIDFTTYKLGEEQIVGTWIDGKPVYRRVEEHTVTSGWQAIATTPNAERYIKIQPVTQTSYVIPFYQSANNYALFYVSSDRRYVVLGSAGLEGRTFTVILEYTKTTD